MDTLLRILAFMIGGGVLAYLALLYFGALYAALFPGRDAKQIAPITTIENGKSSTDLGPALSQMLLVHLAEIRRRLDEAAKALRPGQAGASTANPAVVGPVESQPVALLQDDLPNRLQQSFNVQLNVAGVELTGIANWLFRQFSSTEAMRIVIETVDKKKHVYGNFDPAGVETFVIRLDENPTHDVILAAVAHRIAHRSITRSIPQIGALRDSEFRDLLTALSQLAHLNREIERGRAPAKEFDEVLALLYPLTSKVPKWVALARISGEVAERANNFQRARELYAQAVATEQDAGGREDLTKRLARVDEAIKTASATPRIPAATTSAAASTPVPDAAAKPLLRQVGVSERTMPNTVRIAIIGGPPTGLAESAQLKIFGPETGQGDGKSFLDDYFVKIMSTVSLVAPNTTFVFSRRTVARASDVLEAIQDVLPEQPRIILLPIRGIASPAVEQLLRRIAEQNVVTVLSAGNEGPGTPVPFAGTPLLDQIVIVSAVDGKGNPAVFSQRDAASFWAPGVGIPVPEGSGVTRWDGTGPAAAVAAGVLARIISEKPGIPRAELLAKMRQGAAPMSTQPDAPPVVNAEKTIGLVSAAGGAQPTTAKSATRRTKKAADSSL